jgi:hypothetical protein
MRAALYILVCGIAVCSTLFAMLLLYNPRIEILQLLPGLQEGSANRDFYLPAILTSAIAGGLHLLAVFHLFQRQRKAYSYAIAGGVFVIIWMILQMMIIGYAHWLNLIFLIAGLMSFLIAFQLKGKWAV